MRDWEAMYESLSDTTDLAWKIADCFMQKICVGRFKGRYKQKRFGILILTPFVLADRVHGLQLESDSPGFFASEILSAISTQNELSCYR